MYKRHKHTFFVIMMLSYFLYYKHIRSQNLISSCFFILQLNAKRDLFYRHDPPSSTNSAVAPSVAPAQLTANSNSSSKESLSSRDGDRMKDMSPKDLDGYVGFANLPNQVYRKAVKRGFEFTLMVVGEFLSD